MHSCAHHAFNAGRYLSRLIGINICSRSLRVRGLDFITCTSSFEGPSLTVLTTSGSPHTHEYERLHPLSDSAQQSAALLLQPPALLIALGVDRVTPRFVR